MAYRSMKRRENSRFAITFPRCPVFVSRSVRDRRSFQSRVSLKHTTTNATVYVARRVCRNLIVFDVVNSSCSKFLAPTFFDRILRLV